MMKRRGVLLLSVALFCCTAAAWGVSPANRALLDSLDREIGLRAQYQHERESRIEQYKYRLRHGSLTDQQRYSLNGIVAEEYSTFICDSVIHYHNLNIDLAQKMGDPALENHTRLQLAGTLTFAGMYMGVIHELVRVHREELRTDAEKEAYYNVCYGFYREMIGNTRNDRAREEYTEQAARYQDSLRRVVDPGSDLWLDLEQRDQWNRRNLDEAMRINTLRLEQTHPDEPQHAIVLFWRALLFESGENHDEYLRCLILSAITDIRLATKDHASLSLIASALFEEGDLDRANRYIQVSMADARFYNARLRGVQLTRTVPVIISSYNAKIDTQMGRLRASLIVISVMLALILALSLRLIRQKSRLERSQKALRASNEALEARSDELDAANTQLGSANRKLLEANYVKENYIAQYLGLSSSYISKLEGLRRMINKKLREGKAAEVLDMTRPSMQVTEVELNDFYAYFDAGFLAIFPTFIEEFNDLLQPEARIIPESRNGKPTLSTELRVFALIRLGFQDSSTIAQMLRYSVNTIYNVRAQVKNKAIVERSEFEALVKQIGAFEKK